MKEYEDGDGAAPLKYVCFRFLGGGKKKKSDR